MGEVPMMEVEERTRREASVLRYKEKRQTRLFCKKIRYQVRKLNADKRPRLKLLSFSDERPIHRKCSAKRPPMPLVIDIGLPRYCALFFPLTLLK
ncbi:hypothetical protein V6N13_138567 [Hibiscus sabdariffa]